MVKKTITKSPTQNKGRIPVVITMSYHLLIPCKICSKECLLHNIWERIEKHRHDHRLDCLVTTLSKNSISVCWILENNLQSSQATVVVLYLVLKSGYPNYPKSGYIRAVWPTENRCPKFGYSNSEKNPIFRAFFHDFLRFCMVAPRLYFFQELSFFDFLHSFYCTKMKKKYCWRK